MWENPLDPVPQPGMFAGPDGCRSGKAGQPKGTSSGRPTAGPGRGGDVLAPGLVGGQRVPAGGLPVDLAVYGSDQDRVAKMAKRLGDRLRKSPKLTDVWVGGKPATKLYIDINRAAF